MAVGQGSGVVLLAAWEAGLPVEQYSPNEVKLAVTGYGGAPQAQGGGMVGALLPPPPPPPPRDPAGPAPVAVCHPHPRGRPGRVGGGPGGGGGGAAAPRPALS